MKANAELILDKGAWARKKKQSAAWLVILEISFLNALSRILWLPSSMWKNLLSA